jgi:transposase
MIRYEEFCRIRQGYDQEHLSVAQLAGELGLNVKTVARWVARKEYQPRQRVPRPSKLDAFKGAILRLLAQRARAPAKCRKGSGKKTIPGVTRS